MPLPLIDAISQAATAGSSHRVLLLDVAPATAAARKGRQDRMERHGRDYQERVRGLPQLARRHADAVRVIDASRPFDAVLAEARGHVDALLGARRPGG